jgi:hypothetical protein
MSETENDPSCAPSTLAPQGASAADLPELLVRPLGSGHELLHIFRAGIEERLLYAAAEKGEDTPEAAAAWLATRPAVASRRRWLVPLLVLAVLTTVFALAAGLGEYLPLYAFDGSAPVVVREAAKRQLFAVPPGKRASPLVTYITDPMAVGTENWTNHPGDPVFYHLLVVATMDQEHTLPQDYDASWRGVDPDNAYWLLYRIHAARRTLDPANPFTPGVVLSTLQEAAALPRCHSYRQDQERLYLSEMLPPRSAAGLTARSIAYTQFRLLTGNITSDWWWLSSEIRTHAAEISAGPAGAQGLQKLQDWAAELGKEEAVADPFDLSPSHGNSAAAVAGVRASLVVAGLCLFLCAGVLGLRHWPTRSSAAGMALCVRQLLHPRDLRSILAGGMLIPGGLLGIAAVAFFPWEFRPGIALYATSIPLFLVLPLLALMVAAARREVTCRAGFLDLRGARFQRRISWLVILVSLLPFLALIPLVTSLASPSATGVMPGSWTRSGGANLILAGAGCCSGAVILWLTISMLLGYASPSANVRHRIIAYRLMPALLIAAITVNLLALALYPLESRLVSEAMASAAGSH